MMITFPPTNYMILSELTLPCLAKYKPKIYSELSNITQSLHLYSYSSNFAIILSLILRFKNVQIPYVISQHHVTIATLLLVYIHVVFLFYIVVI